MVFPCACFELCEEVGQDQGFLELQEHLLHQLVVCKHLVGYTVQFIELVQYEEHQTILQTLI